MQLKTVFMYAILYYIILSVVILPFIYIYKNLVLGYIAMYMAIVVAGYYLINRILDKATPKDPLVESLKVTGIFLLVVFILDLIVVVKIMGWSLTNIWNYIAYALIITSGLIVGLKRRRR